MSRQTSNVFIGCSSRSYVHQLNVCNHAVSTFRGGLLTSYMLLDMYSYSPDVKFTAARLVNCQQLVVYV